MNLVSNKPQCLIRFTRLVYHKATFQPIGIRIGFITRNKPYRLSVIVRYERNAKFGAPKLGRSEWIRDTEVGFEFILMSLCDKIHVRV